jgi:general secretion pathway protein D
LRIRYQAFLICIISITVIMATVIGASAQPAKPPQPTGAGAGLDKKIEGPVIARNQDMHTLLTLLQTESGIQMILGEGINKKVTFSLDSPSIRSVLETVLPANGLDYIVLESGIVRIDTHDNILILKTPDVELMTRTFSPVYLDVIELEEILGQLKSPQGTITIDNRSQQVIVNDIPEAIQAMQQMINQLDVEMETRLFDLKFANAEEIVNQLQGVLSAEEGKLVVDYRNNRLIITDTLQRLDQAQAIIEELDMELQYKIIPLAFSLPEDILPLVETLLTENGYVDFDPRTSRIIIQDIPSVVEQVMRLIKDLDIPTEQIWVEVDLIQISNNKSFTLGTAASFGSDIGAGGDPNAPEGVSSATDGVFSFNPFLVTGASGLTLNDVRKGSYRVQIDAMVKKEMAEIIASPRLLIQDGEMGSFTLGSEEPYAVRQQGYSGYNSGSSGGDYFTQRSRQVGTTIELECYSSEAGYVEMFISIENSSARRVALSNLGEGLAVDGSFVNTVATVKSGRTVVLGGIINRKSSKTQSGVPILSSIPILGNLFKSKSTEDDRGKLLIFITPRIVNIDDPFDFAQVDNFQRLRDLQSKGVTKFVETTVDDKFLDWSSEEENEESAIKELLGEDAKTSKVKTRTPSKKEQLDSGIIRVEKEKDF